MQIEEINAPGFTPDIRDCVKKWGFTYLTEIQVLAAQAGIADGVSHADAPRGMEFLYSLNRLNVATSRAKCLSILISSPKVFEAECHTPRQMQLVNAFCRYIELVDD